MAIWVEFWTESSGETLPGWWSKVRPDARAWLEAYESVTLCTCDGAPTWMVNNDLTKAAAHRACGGLRASRRCIVGRSSDNPGHGDHPYGCRSTDTRHIEAAIQWLRYDVRALNMAIEMTALRDGREPVLLATRSTQAGGTDEVERDDD